MQPDNVQFVWPGLFWAIQTFAIFVAMPALLLSTVFRHLPIPKVIKVVLVPFCIAGPMLLTMLWPFALSMSGLVQVGGPDGSVSASYETAYYILGDYSIYLWTGITALVLYKVYSMIRSRSPKLVPAKAA